MLSITTFTIKLSANKAAGAGKRVEVLGEEEDVGGVVPEVPSGCRVSTLGSLELM